MQPVDGTALAHALERVITWLRDSREQEDLSASVLSALSRLDSGGAQRITELAEREGLSQPGLTTLANRLEAAGLATREPDPADRRAVRLAITPAGVERLRAYREARASLISARIAQLPATDQAALIAAGPALVHFVESSAKQ